MSTLEELLELLKQNKEVTKQEHLKHELRVKNLLSERIKLKEKLEKFKQCRLKSFEKIYGTSCVEVLIIYSEVISNYKQFGGCGYAIPGIVKEAFELVYDKPIYFPKITTYRKSGGGYSN